MTDSKKIDRDSIQYWQGCLNRAKGDVLAAVIIQGKINSLMREKDSD